MNPVVTSDPELARALLNGEAGAFDAFVSAYRGKLFNYTFLMCGQREDAEEVAQETLLKVFESFDQLREPDRLKSWVFRIAKNFCLMKRRKSVFAPEVELSLDELKPARADGDAIAIDIADWSALPEHAAANAELREVLAAAVRDLPEMYRSVFLLRDVEELSTEETAQILDVSLDVIKTRLHRARLALRQKLDQHLRTSKGVYAG
ncbi:MAG: sigma-70 family RNA polymerase sigma factor [Acidobacteria bacterium]|nr:sigma-70 family RNA polymerase sigma factor [Acidobacteriota bacterium]